MKEILQKARAERIIFGCDFCDRRNVKKETMERHEKMCYYNPDRECPFCHGKKQWGDGIHEPIEYCGACITADGIQEERERYGLT